jgi:hypothetical protein
VLGKGLLFKLHSVFLFFSSWCKILRVEKLQQILVVVVNGVRDDTEQFQGWKQLFTSVRKYRKRLNVNDGFFRRIFVIHFVFILKGIFHLLNNLVK